MERRTLGVLAVGAVGFAVMYGAVSSARSENDERDAGAVLACQEFRRVAADYDTLTVVELRDRIRDVYDDAKVADSAGIRNAGHTLMVAFTSGTEGEQVAAVNGFGTACRAAGV